MFREHWLFETAQDSTINQERIADSESCRYLASPEVVAASALSGKISGPGWYRQPEGISGVVMGEGDGVKEEERMITTEEAIEKIIDQLDHVLETAESENDSAPEAKRTKEIEILPGFSSNVEGGTYISELVLSSPFGIERKAQNILLQ